MKFDYKRILIVGCGGAGKSTLAVQLGNKLNLLVVHLDKLHWLPNWIERPNEEFEILLRKELLKDKWIIDGNYKDSLQERLKYADCCIFLDYSLDLCVKSVKERVEMYKGRTRPDMTDGCEEQADEEFINWIRDYDNNIKPIILQILQENSVPYLIFTQREQTSNWLENLE